MKTIKYLALIALIIGLSSYDKNENVTKEDPITFVGTYGREFGTQDTLRTVNYTIKKTLSIITYMADR